MSHSPLSLEGRTIRRARSLHDPKYDDKGYLRLEFTDGTMVIIAAGFCSYTGKNMDEYPTAISINENDESLTETNLC